MKNLIKNTILVVVMVVLGLFLTSCEKSNVEPVVPIDTTPTEGLLTVYTEADSVLVKMYEPKFVGSETIEYKTSEFKVYKGEPKNIKVEGIDPQSYHIYVIVLVYSNTTLKPSSVKVIDHKNREVSYRLVERFISGSAFNYELYYTFIFNK